MEGLGDKINEGYAKQKTVEHYHNAFPINYFLR